MANYPNITTDECGISRDSLLMDNNCFTYHKMDNTVSRIFNGYQPKRFILHPGFEINQTNSDDIGLIELNTALDFTAPKGSHYRPINSVCLPKADIYNTDKEYALVAGFGAMNYTKHLADWLQMGWIRIWEKKDTRFDYYGKMIIARQVADSVSVCRGDSGGGVIQWQNGKAVVIGIVHAKMANYPNITTDECGISRDSLLMDNNCFPFHKMDDTVSRIFNGRRATVGELPWHVFITSDLFIFWNGLTITIYPGILNISNLGIGYQPKSIIIHEGFVFNQNNPDDIALIELNTALDLTASKGSHYRRVNSVCLPKPDIYNTRKEYALVAGFGRINDTHNPDWLQVGWSNFCAVNISVINKIPKPKYT
ncbi:unnamed protein product [Medioppia subpectinata]|uniref:Peptidase S1 domain-containing protein n=1 Tax=Medioppia subpectinata TaxID=1979941 RepID=A0A7R9KJ64_9ACAR|nr:unnamed protein product [Medioppia subpectinata]CAG2104649.1 unnamed protein product [Medioppia subpectinata]